MTRAARPSRASHELGRYGVTLFTLALGWLWLTTPWWYQGLVVPFDSINHFYATLRGVARHLAAGDWPAWLPETYGGRPTLADPQSLVATPSLLTLAWLDPTPSIHAMDMVVHAHLLVGGGAVACWGLRRGAHPLAALLAAIVFAFGGSAMARSQHTLLLLSYAWIPLAMLSVELLLERPNARRAVLAALVVAVLTLQRDHVALMGHFVVAGTALAWLAGEPAPLRRARRALPWVGLSLALWLALVAVPLLASLAYVAQSNRPGFEAELVGRVLSLPWAGLLTLPFPSLFAAAEGLDAYWGPGSRSWSGFWFDASVVQIAIGVVPTVVLLWLGLARGFAASPGARLGAVVALLALAYALGARTPFFAAAFASLPGLDLYQRPADATFVVNLGLAFLLAGVADRYIRAGLRPARPRRFLIEAVGWLAFVAVALAVAAHFERLGVAWGAVLLPTLLAAGTVFALAWGAGRGGRARAAVIALLVAVTVVELRAHTVGTPLNAVPPAEAPPLTDPMADPLARWLTGRLAELEGSEGAFRVELLGLGGAWQNASLALGVDNVLGYNPLRDARFERATGAGQNSHEMRRRFGTLMTGYAAPFTDILGVRYVVLGGPMAEVDPASVPDFPPPRRIGHALVYANPDAVPRLVLVAAENVRGHDPEAVLASGELPEFDGRREALIERAAPRPAGPPAPFAGTLQVVERGPDRVRVRVETERSAWLVFHEMSHPGWAARVDGAPRPIARANVLFQAVRVEPGEREVVFTYAPWRAARAALAEQAPWLRPSALP